MTSTSAKIRKTETAEAIRKERKATYMWQGKKKVPRIDLSGDYLIKAGFEIGQTFKIEISNNQIIITK